MKEAAATNSVQEIRKHPLRHLDYFMEWGGTAWQHLMNHAIEHFLGTALQGQQVLDIGTRYGKMACLFALLGGRVIGLDIADKALSLARKEATKMDVSERVEFVCGKGNLSIFNDNTFDAVFSKSVLVLVPDLTRFLEEVNAKLKPGGKIIFLENLKGPWFIHILRAFRHREWDYTKARYFTPQEIRLVSDIFDEVVVRRRTFPPVVLIMGRKKVT
jgi:ubiquinone/menaquinone biosynthesis C-methylase UbiE